MNTTTWSKKKDRLSKIAFDQNLKVLLMLLLTSIIASTLKDVYSLRADQLNNYKSNSQEATRSHLWLNG